MKLATYNIWESPAGMPHRFNQIIEEILSLDTDILCLQEVADIEMHNELASKGQFSFEHYQATAGVSIFSHFPIIATRDCEFATSTLLQLERKTLLVTNLHLPWKSALSRERAIVNIIEQTENIVADYTLLVGDFNCSENSSVHQFLLGDRSLMEHDAYFFDLAEAYAQISGEPPKATLNFKENPRWGTVEPYNTVQVNQRFDRILLKNPYPKATPHLKRCDIFGTQISAASGLAASDHYGVFVILNF